jgi:hypothetical protein
MPRWLTASCRLATETRSGDLAVQTTHPMCFGYNSCMVALTKKSANFPQRPLRVRAQDHRYRLGAERCSKSNSQDYLRVATYVECKRLESCSKDPIGYPGGTNLYEYGTSRPLVALDFSGNVPIICSCTCSFTDCDIGSGGATTTTGGDVEVNCMRLASTCCSKACKDSFGGPGTTCTSTWRKKGTQNPPQAQPCFKESCKLNCKMAGTACAFACFLAPVATPPCIVACTAAAYSCEIYACDACLPGWDPTDPRRPPSER